MKPRLRFVCHRPAILLGMITLVVHCLALNADWYMDDFSHILASVRGSGWNRVERGLVYGIWDATEWAVGFSRVGFHLLTWLGHGLVVCVVFQFFKEVLHGSQYPAELRSKVAFLAALLTAVHPLMSEAVCYASQLTIILATLGAYLSGWAYLKWTSDAGDVWFGITLLGAVVAVFSKNPGIFHLLIVMSAAYLVPGEIDVRGRFKERPIFWSVGMLLVLLGAGVMFWMWKGRILGQLRNPFVGIHAATQVEVFWNYVWRVVWPDDLISDHHIPWTVNPWTKRMLLMQVGCLCLIGLLFRLWLIGWRAEALGLFLFLAHLWLRFAYMGREVMVEYRVYPALPGIALVAAGCWGRAAPRLGRIAVPIAIALAVALGMRTIVREWNWRDREVLAKQVHQHYPFNIRALGHLAQIATAREDWNELCSLSDEAKKVTELVIKDHEKQRLHGRSWDLSRMFDRTIEMIVTGAYADTLSGDPDAGIARLSDGISFLDQFASYFPDDDDPKAPLGRFVLAKADITAYAGDREAAIFFVEQSRAWGVSEDLIQWKLENFRSQPPGSVPLLLNGYIFSRE